MNGSYRSPLTFNAEVIEQSKNALERLRSGVRPATPLSSVPEGTAEGLLAAVQITQDGFEASMDDDFNTAGALGHLFDLVKAINQARTQGLDADALGSAQSVLSKLAGVLGLRLEAQLDVGVEAAPFIELALEIRQQLRDAKQFELADQIRVRLQELGVVLEDGREGTIWHLE